MVEIKTVAVKLLGVLFADTNFTFWKSGAKKLRKSVCIFCKNNFIFI